MNLTFLKKRLFYGLVFALLAQVIGISKAMAQATTPFKTTWIATGGSITIPTNSASGPYNYTVNYRKKGTIPFTRSLEPKGAKSELGASIDIR